MHFEMVENVPLNSKNKVHFIQCSQCGLPVGAMEYFVNFEKMDALKKDNENLNHKIDNLEIKINNLTRLIQSNN